MAKLLIRCSSSAQTISSRSLYKQTPAAQRRTSEPPHSSLAKACLFLSFFIYIFLADDATHVMITQQIMESDDWKCSRQVIPAGFNYLLHCNAFASPTRSTKNPQSIKWNGKKKNVFKKKMQLQPKLATDVWLYLVPSPLLLLPRTPTCRVVLSLKSQSLSERL